MPSRRSWPQPINTLHPYIDRSRCSTSQAESDHFADDERSNSDSSDMIMDLSNEHGRRKPRYHGEDTRPISTKELYGFYAYSFAAEVFIVCGIGSFIPITLEQLARERGVLQTDRTTPCIQQSSIHPAREPGSPSLHFEKPQCIVSVLGLDVNTASFAMYTFSISVLIQAIVVVTFSGAADHGQYRKSLLLAFAFTGSLITMLFILTTSSLLLLAALCAIIGNVCCASSFVLLNSFLPLLVRWHPTTQIETFPYRDEVDETNVASESDRNDHNSGAERTPLIPPLVSDHALDASSLQLSTKISSYGMGTGYLAALILQTLSIIIVVTMGSTTSSLRLVLFFVGFWWFVFTIPAALCLRPRPGPALSTIGTQQDSRAWIGYLTYSWVNLAHTFLRARRLKDVLLFLGAWFLVSDAIATVSGTAVLFAKTTLGMQPAALSAINVITTVCGVIGAFTWSKVSRMMQLTPSQTILGCIFMFELIPLYGLLGYVPAIQRIGLGGLQQPWEMYPLGAIYGLVLGGLGSYCRSLFGELIPEGSEAAFYALYAVTDKGSSIFGPVVVGAIADATGEIRPAFWFLAVLIALPIPLIYMVDVERGKREGAAVAVSYTSLTPGRGLGIMIGEDRSSSGSGSVQT